MIGKLIYIGYDFGQKMKKKNISAFAASTAFFLFLSLIPALMLLCAVIPYTPLTEAGLMEAVTDIAPDSMDAMLVSVIAQVYDKSIGILSLSAVATLWSAGKGILALMRGLNAVNDVEEDKNYFLLRLVASFYTVMVLVMIIISLLLMVFGSFLAEVTENIFPKSVYVFEVMMHFRIPVLWAVMAGVLALIYAYVPGRKMKLRLQLPGAVFAAVGWSFITWAFSVYVEEFNGFTAYGNLTTIIILMLWLYFGMYIVLAGACLNGYFKPAFQFLADKKHIDKKEKID